MELKEFTIRIMLSVILGFIIGLERQLTGHRSSIRINILVSLGSAMFVLFPMVMGSNDLRSASQIITGVGFLCSGIIFKDGLNVRGLNTAATIWCTAAIGVLTSSGRPMIAIVATLVLIVSNLLFRPISNYFQPSEYLDETEKYYKISITCSEDYEMKVRNLVMTYLKNSELIVTHLQSIDILGSKVEIEATLLCNGKRKDEDVESLVATITLEKDVTAVGWELI